MCPHVSLSIFSEIQSMYCSAFFNIARHNSRYMCCMRKHFELKAPKQYFIFLFT